MTLRRRSIYHRARDVSFTGGPVGKVAFVDAAHAWMKERSHAD